MPFRLARQGVFYTVQGEGVMMGTPQVFVRLAGCNVGCPECDTDYRPAQMVTLEELARLIVAAAPPAAPWVWVTGGEPMLHGRELPDLYRRLQPLGFRFALATSGTIPIPSVGRAAGGPDFVSVSPHRIDDSWTVHRGDQLNAVVGLGGLRLADLERVPAGVLAGFTHRFVTPADPGRGLRPNYAECAAWVAARPGWRLGIQAHKVWGVP